MENPIKMDDLGVTLFVETPMLWGCYPSETRLVSAFFIGVTCHSIYNGRLRAHFVWAMIDIYHLK